MILKCVGQTEMWKANINDTAYKIFTLFFRFFKQNLNKADTHKYQHSTGSMQRKLRFVILW